MADPRTFAEEELDELEFDQFDQDQGDKDKKPFTEVGMVKSTIQNSRMVFGRMTFYSEAFSDMKFGGDSPYYGTLFSQTEYYFAPPQVRRQELPTKINGEYTYFYRDPLEKPVIMFYRIIELKLDTGNSVEFAVYGSMQIPDTIYPQTVVSIADLERYMNTPDSPFVLAGLGSKHMADLSGFNLGMREDMNLKDSMNEVLIRMGLGDIAKVSMTAKEQYDFMVRFIENHPALDGWLTENVKSTKTVHKQKGKAEEAIFGTRNSVVTQDDQDYKASILGIQDMAAIADQLRRRKNNPNAEGPLGKNESIVSANYQGQSIGESDLIDLFFTSVDVAVMDPEGKGIANVLVYKMEGDYFGRQRLTKEEAHQHWRKLDTVGKPEDLSKWNVKDKFGLHWNGTFQFLYAQGTIEVHRVDESYYRGRRFFTDNKNVLNQTMLNDANDGKNMGYAELTALTGDAGDHFYWYLRGELDRPATDATYFRSIINTYGTKTLFSGSFQSDLGKWIYDEVNNDAKVFATEKVSGISSFLGELWQSREALEVQLGAMADLDSQKRRDIVSAFGFEHEAQDELVNLFSSKTKTAELLLGVEVDGYTVEKIVARIQESATKMSEFLGDIVNDRVDTLAMEGEFGNMVREHAYKKAGFTKLKHWDFPHDDQASSTYSTATAYNYTNTKEQLYAYYVYNTETWKMVLTIIVVVIVAVIIALATMGVGLFVAAAVGATGFGAVVVSGAVAGILFTVVSEIILQSMGQGTLNRDKNAYGIWEFLGQMVLNVVMFVAFGAFGEIFGSMAAAAKAAGASRTVMFALKLERLSAMAMLFTTISLAHFYIDKGRLPEGREWKKFWLENILALVLFEVGGAIAKGGLMRLRSSGSSIYAKNMSTKFDVAMNNIVSSHKSIAEIGAGAEKPVEAQTEITKTYIERLKVMEDLMAKYQKKANDTEWKVTNEKGEKMTLEEAKQYQADLKATRLALENALYLKYTGTEKVIGTSDTLSYNGTKEGAKLIEKKHKAQGDRVMKPDESGRIVVHLKTEKTIEYLPDSQVSTEGLQVSLMKETSLSGTLRQISKNIMGVDQNKVSTLKQQFSDGKWVELREGEMYFGEKVINGQKQTLFFLVEEKLNIANEAWLSEQNSPGTGLGIIRSSLRSPEAVEGYTDYVENKWKSMDESSKVKEFWELEQKGEAKGKHLNEILEERAVELKSKIQAREKMILGIKERIKSKTDIIEKATEEELQYIFENEFLETGITEDITPILNQRFEGRSNVKFKNDPVGKEYDHVTDELLIEYKKFTTTSDNSIGQKVRAEYKTHFLACKTTGRRAFFIFEGTHNEAHIARIKEYADRYEVPTTIEENGIIIYNKN
ncbi:MAG: restriction endonuclease fold toxin [Fluviicola sp.]|nr:restriction endonuclease fold toxin [Fluviicola sp.]